MSDLQTALNQALQNQGERLVRFRADDNLPFGQVAQVIDGCSSVNAKVGITTE
jgi:biopolymer transport protein ExbD